MYKQRKKILPDIKCKVDIKLFLYGMALVLFVSCKAGLPKDFTASEKSPAIYPDYKQVTVPCNIAPLNFAIEEEGDKFLSKIYSENDDPIIVKGKTVDIKDKKWQHLLLNNKGKDLHIDIFVKKNDKWTKYKTIKNHIAEDEIDGYIAYRIIEPLYAIWEDIFIMQRDLSSFKEKVIYDNALMQTEENGQCVNCHSFQDYNKKHNFQIHVRGYSGGTVIENNGDFKKVNLKTDSTISAGVYPAWHPTENLLAYSVNSIGQMFHTKDQQKIEVMDSKSDVIVYDVDKNDIKFVAKSPDYLETFPYWSPAGDALLYASAYYKPEFEDGDVDLGVNYQKIHYNIMKVDYDIKSGEFGKTDTLFNAAKIGKSATFPRISPNGKYLMFTMADYGNFHIWHRSSDLYLFDMQNESVRNVKEINSPDVESYHSWSSNGKWIIFSSKREDGAYTRLFIAHFNEDGIFSKPFVLPQRNPYFNKEFFKSYNILEFLASPVDFKAQDLPKVIRKEAIQANFKSE